MSVNQAELSYHLHCWNGVTKLVVTVLNELLVLSTAILLLGIPIKKFPDDNSPRYSIFPLESLIFWDVLLFWAGWGCPLRTPSTPLLSISISFALALIFLFSCNIQNSTDLSRSNARNIAYLCFAFILHIYFKVIWCVSYYLLSHFKYFSEQGMDSINQRIKYYDAFFFISSSSPLWLILISLCYQNFKSLKAKCKLFAPVLAQKTLYVVSAT